MDIYPEYFTFCVHENELASDPLNWTRSLSIRFVSFQGKHI